MASVLLLAFLSSEINYTIYSYHSFNLNNQNAFNKNLSTKYHIIHNINMCLEGYIKWKVESGKLRELEVMAHVKSPWKQLSWPISEEMSKGSNL